MRMGNKGNLFLCFSMRWLRKDGCEKGDPCLTQDQLVT